MSIVPRWVRARAGRLLDRLDPSVATALRALRGQSRHYTGNLFDRFVGLEPVFERCPGATVLGIGSCEGLIAYECARHGARLVHGFEIDPALVDFARRLFGNVPVESHFARHDFSSGFEDFERRFAAVLRPRYDLVLYLGVHHHLKKVMSAEALDTLVRGLLARAEAIFAVRTDLLPELEATIREAGFEGISETASDGKVGRLAIYRRR